MRHRFQPLLSGILLAIALALTGWILPAQATNWQAIAQSLDGQSVQYVDVDSVARSGAVMRLKSYWMDRDHPDAKTDVITEYQCDRQQYRDLEVNGVPQQQHWQAIADDRLNQMVLDFACQYQTSAVE